MRYLILALALLSASASAKAETTETLTASAYGRSGCRAALVNVSKVADSQGVRTWASYTIWTCAPGAATPEQVVVQRSVLIPDAQFSAGNGNGTWALTLSTGDGSVTLQWRPDGRVHSTFDQTWTSSIAGQPSTKTTKSLTTDSAPPTGVLFGVSPEAVSGTVMRGLDVSKP